MHFHASRTMKALLTGVVLVFAPQSLHAEIHQEVQSALEWELPPLKCKQPKASRDIQQYEASGGYISHSPTNTTEESSGAPTVFDIDHYKVERYQRKKKRWQKCVSAYKAELLVQFESLKSSAQHGLTKEQASIIMSKLALIQSAVMSPTGVVSDHVEQSKTDDSARKKEPHQ